LLVCLRSDTKDDNFILRVDFRVVIFVSYAVATGKAKGVAEGKENKKIGM
jgi:hypothetical protein